MTKELDTIAEIAKSAYQINAIAKEGLTDTKVSVDITKGNGVVIFVDGKDIDEDDSMLATADLDRVLDTVKGILEASEYKSKQFLRAHETKASIALAEVRDSLKKKYGIELNQTSWNKIFKECMENWEAVEDGTKDK